MQKLYSLFLTIKRSFGYGWMFAPSLTAILIVAAAAINILPIYQAKIMGDIVNQVAKSLNESTPVSVVLGLVIVYAIAWAGVAIASSIRLYFEKGWYIKMEHGLELETMRKRSEIDIGHYEDPDFQNLLHRSFIRGIWPVHRIADGQFTSFGSVAAIIVSSLVAVQLNSMLYLVIIATSLPTFFVNLKYGHDVWSIWAENSPRRREYDHMRFHIINRIGVLQAKLFQAGDHLLEKSRAILELFARDIISTDRKKMWLSLVANVVAAAGYAVGFYLIIQDVASGKSDIGSMVFLISAMGYLVGAVGSFLQELAQQNEFALYAKDIFAVFDTKPFIKKVGSEKPLHLTSSPKIEFKNVSFMYPKSDKLTLKNISFTIEPGEKIAVVGQNGAGKSTLVKLLARIYDPTEGQILVNGIDLRQVDPNEWSGYISLLLQDYMMYEFTVAEHIAMGRSNQPIDRDRVLLAAELSGVSEFAADYEKGLEQRLGKEFTGGVEPSKGQKQKLALAKTIYRNAKVMILDEPTAAIDALAEQYIFDQMEQASGSNTLVVITHRFSTTQKMDRIIVLDHNILAEIGTHEELLAKNGLYKQVFDVQKKSFVEKRSKKVL